MIPTSNFSFRQALVALPGAGKASRNGQTGETGGAGLSGCLTSSALHRVKCRSDHHIHARALLPYMYVCTSAHTGQGARPPAVTCVWKYTTNQPSHCRPADRPTERNASKIVEREEDSAWMNHQVVSNSPIIVLTVTASVYTSTRTYLPTSDVSHRQEANAACSIHSLG